MACTKNAPTAANCVFGQAQRAKITCTGGANQISDSCAVSCVQQAMGRERMHQSYNAPIGCNPDTQHYKMIEQTVH